jgi:hypothetical protein
MDGETCLKYLVESVEQRHNFLSYIRIGGNANQILCAMAGQELNLLVKAMARCIHACERCAADCLNERDAPQVRTCISTSLDCADICSLTLKMISRESTYWDHLLQLCVRVCQDCAKECGKHNALTCQDCAEACQYCIVACEQYITIEMN